MDNARRWIALVCCLASAAGCSDEPRGPNVVLPETGGGSGMSGASGAGAIGGGGDGGDGAGAAGHSGASGASSESCDLTGMLSFAMDIRPILSRCGGCHDDRGDAGLDARSLSGLLSGGDHGPALIPGDCQESLLYQKTSAMPPFGARMPLGGAMLTEAERQTLCTWIEQGAVENPVSCPSGGAGGIGGGAGVAGMGASSDVTSPSFDGVDRVREEDGGCDVTWRPARDDVTATSAILYDVYVLLEDGALDPSMPSLTTAPGATSARVMPAVGADYDIVVLARDEAGNRSLNADARECSLR